MFKKFKANFRGWVGESGTNLLSDIFSGYAISFANDKYYSDEEIMYEAIRNYSGIMMYACEELKRNKEFVLSVIEVSGQFLNYVDDSLKNDLDIAMVMYSYDKSYFDEFSDEIKTILVREKS